MAKKEVPLSIAGRIEKIEALQALPPLPFGVMCSGIELRIYGDLIAFARDGDYLTLKQAQDVIKYFAKELGLQISE